MSTSHSEQREQHTSESFTFTTDAHAHAAVSYEYRDGIESGVSRWRVRGAGLHCGVDDGCAGWGGGRVSRDADGDGYGEV